MRRLSSLTTLLFFVFSCSIIKDDDILTQEVFDNNLVVERIEIADPVFGLNTSAFFTYSSNGKLSQVSWNFLPPNFDEETYSGGRVISKLRFNLFFDVNDPDGIQNEVYVTTSFIYDGAGRITSISNRYDDNGIGTILFQQFNYTYDTSGKLIEIETLNNQHDIDNKTTTTDVLNYTNGKITSVARTVETTSSTFLQTISVKYSGIGVISEIKKGNTTTLNGCAVNNTNSHCYFSETTNVGYSNSIIVYGEGGKPNQISMTETRFEENGTTGVFGDQTGRPPDYFFVSPYVFIQDLFEDGRDLAQIFIDDWWIKGVGTNSNIEVTFNETVTLDLTYTLLQ